MLNVLTVAHSKGLAIVEKGTLVEFWLHGNRRLAVIDRPEGKKHWIALDEREQAHTLHPRQVTYTVAGCTYQPAGISGFWQSVQPYLDASSLEVAWELLVEDGESVSPATLAQLLFSQQEPALCYAAYYLLSEDKLYFKQKGDHYEPRSAAQVAELKHQMMVANQRLQEWQEFLTCVQQVLAARNQSSVPQTAEILAAPPEMLDLGQGKLGEPRFRQRLESLERFATFGEEATHRAPALELLVALERPETPQAAIQLLVDLGLWSRHENLFLRRSQIPTQFPSKVLEVLQSRIDAPPPDRYSMDRLDLTHLKVYTIDDESTQEIDDGLSLEYLPEGQQRLWIHIADPTRWVLPGDELDLEARRRSTTLYLPTGMIPMFPSQLATGPMSLVQGRICCALSFGVLLTETGAIADYTIQISLIKPTYRLTYDDVDEMLELGIQAEPEISAIAAWAKRRQEWRQAQGAITINMPESSIKVQDDEITIRVLDDSFARQLVAEMMILAGEVAGRYGQAHNLAIPFRNQAQPELPPEDELMRLPPGVVRACALRRCMPRSEISTTPSRHASLGLDTYTQVTSPIRRYGDLLTHFQLKAHLKGDPLPFSIGDMRELLQSISTTAYEAVQVERQTNRYWGLEYLRRHAGQTWSALVLRWLREHENLALVLLEDLGLELAMRFQRPVEPGDQIEIKVAYVDPRQDTIQLQEISDREMQSAYN